MYKVLSLLCISSLPYLFYLHSDFVFDDTEAIVKNKNVYRNSWTDTFNNDFWGTDIRSNLSHKSYRPLTILSFRLNYFLSGQQLNAYHYKITNIICHAICSILVWQTYVTILRCDTKSKKWFTDEAYLSAILFSVHPIHTEAVSGIVGRADIIAGITFFLAFLAYNKAIKPSTKYPYIYLFMTIISSAISMLFKENGITVLGFCIIYELVYKTRIKKRRIFKIPQMHLPSGSVVRIFMNILALLILLYGRWTVMGGTKPDFKPTDNPAAFSNDLFTKIMTYNYIYYLNILLLIWPHWLCYDWSMGCVPLIKNMSDYRIVLVLLMYLYGILIIKALYDGRNKQSTKRQIVLATSLMVLPFLPAANVFYAVGFVVAERVLYISSAGFCLLTVIGLTRIIHRKTTSKVTSFLYLLLLLSFSLKSWHRSYDWKNEYLLFTSALSVCPMNAKVRYNIAKAADSKLNSTWALEEYRTAISLYPEYYQAMNNLANLLKNMKQYEEAEFYLRKAISYKEDFPAAWMNLGIVLANTKRYNESHDSYRTALKYRHNYPDCFYNLGNLHLETNDTKAAMEAWLEAIRLSPQHNLAWTNLLALLDNTGQIQKALQFIPRALKELSSSPSVNFAIANIYGKIDRYEDAERHFLLAIKLFGTKVQAIHYANLGVLYHRWKKYSAAQKMYENALIIDPHFRSASRNLQSLSKYLRINSVT